MHIFTPRLNMYTFLSFLRLSKEKFLNSPVERTKLMIRLWTNFLAFSKVFGEILLWLCTCTGPFLVLFMVILADTYLVWKPFIFSLLPGSDYKKAFLEAKVEVARFFRNHINFWYKHEIQGKYFSNSSMYTVQVHFTVYSVQVQYTQLRACPCALTA